MINAFCTSYAFIIQNLIIKITFLIFFNNNCIMLAYTLTRPASHTHLIFSNLTFNFVFRCLNTCSTIYFVIDYRYF